MSILLLIPSNNQGHRYRAIPQSFMVSRQPRYYAVEKPCTTACKKGLRGAVFDNISRILSHLSSLRDASSHVIPKQTTVCELAVRD